VALLLWVASRHATAEWITLLYCVLFALALGYAPLSATSILTVLPMVQVLVRTGYLGSSIGLALLGASSLARLGRFVAALLVLEFGYVLARTYAVKLIPLYGGYDGRTSLVGVATLYSRRLGMLATNLDTAALAPAAAIFALAGLQCCW